MKHSIFIWISLIKFLSDTTVSASNLLPKIAECGALSESDRISGGEDAAIDAYPWLALIEYKRSGDYDSSQKLSPNFLCGGSLVNFRYVLTSAHCYTGRDEAISVRLGEYQISTTTDCIKFGSDDGVCVEEPVQNIEIEKFIVHENYVINEKRRDYRGGQNDIALIRLKRPAEINFAVSPICLPITDALKSLSFANQMVLYVAGWGLTENGTTSDIKQTLKVPTVNPRTCEKAFTSRIVSAAQICAGGEKGKDACRGDSGGPLMHLNLGLSPFWHLVGIVSYGPPCGSLKDKPRPSVYVAVSKYMDWIVANMHE